MWYLCEQLISVCVFTVITQNEFSKKLFLVKKCARNYIQLSTKDRMQTQHHRVTIVIQSHTKLIAIDAKNKMY